MTIKQYITLCAVVVCFGFLGGVAASGFLSAEPARAEGGVVTATGFNIFDASGNLRMMLTTNSDNDAPMIIFVDADGKTREVFGLSGNGEPVVSMSDGNEVMREVLALTDDEGPAIEMYDETGDKTIFSAPGAAPKPATGGKKK